MKQAASATAASSRPAARKEAFKKAAGNDGNFVKAGGKGSNNGKGGFVEAGGKGRG